ncbi:MAG: hypothetical protein ACLVLH_13305 [Eisenbergiella massiliensis]
MAWYSGTFYCGHEGYINIIGPLKNREKMREYKFSGLCPACCREALLQSRNEQNAAARRQPPAWSCRRLRAAGSR